MTSGWNSFNPRQQEAAFRLFDDLNTIDSIADAIAEDRQRRAGISDLFMFATEPEAEMSPELSDALDSSPRLRDDLFWVLERSEAYRFPKAAAASTGPVAQRDSERYRISLRPSRADPKQVYVLINLSDLLATPPRLLYIYRPGYRCEKYRLPAAHDGAIQILTDLSSPLVEALRDNNAEVFLR